jgi:hypothetical protein
MFRPKAIPFLFLLLISLSSVITVKAQEIAAGPLQLGQPVERTITRRTMQSYTVNLQENQFMRLVVEQHGIDVVVSVIAPGGKSMGEFDSPNGTEGPEEVALVADTAGVYRVNVVPLEGAENELSGRYEIRLLELRTATDSELDSIKKQQAAKAKSPALLAEVAAGLPQIRLPETRVRLQVQTAQLLWATDEKLARKLMDDAIAGTKEYMASIDVEESNYYQNYQYVMQLRNDIVTALAQRDPELALDFLRSTRTLPDPNEGQNSNEQPGQEAQLELTLANEIAQKNSRVALRIAEENLKKGYSYNLVQTLLLLQTSDKEAAAKLADELADKLLRENLIKNQAAANLAYNLLQMARTPPDDSQSPNTSAEQKRGLLPEQKYRDLFMRALDQALAYASSADSTYTNERNSAQNLLNSIKSLPEEIGKYAPERAQLVEKRSTELNNPPGNQANLWQKYQEKINNASLDASLESVAQAPPEMRDQLYNQIAQKAFQSGDAARARQILTDYIKNFYQRRQAISNLERQAVYNAINNGKVDEALRAIGTLRKPSEQAALLIQIVNQGAAVQKKATVLKILEQARTMISGSGRAEDQEQMNLLFELARAFMRVEPKRSAEIIEPLADQFNEMSAAALPLNGFGQTYYREGELLLQNGNSLGNVANQLIQTLGALAVIDFDRARGLADRLGRPEVRISAYLVMARQTMQGGNERVIRGGYGYGYIGMRR